MFLLGRLFVVAQSFSCVRIFVTPWTAARLASLSFTISQRYVSSTQVHWVGDAIQTSHPLSSPSPPAFNLSQHQGHGWHDLQQRHGCQFYDCKALDSTNQSEQGNRFSTRVFKKEAPVRWPPDANRQLVVKDSDAGKDWRQKERRVTEGEVVGWHHQFNGHELGQTPTDSEVQGGLVCYSPWDRKESDMS